MLARLKGDYRLMAELLYGSGLRLMECLRLRIKDIDFGYNRITVRDTKGLRDRVALLPQRLQQPLRGQIAHVKELHRQYLARGGGKVYLPFALERKYPNAARDLMWQYLFPAAKPSLDPRSGDLRRHHVSEENLQNAVKLAIRGAGIRKPASCHTFRHSFATHLLKAGTTSVAFKNCWTQKRRYHNDLYARFESSRRPHPEPARPGSDRRRLVLGFMLDEKMFAFYYEPSPNSR